MGHRVSHPPLKPRPTGSLTPASNGKQGCRRSRLVLSRRLSKKDAADACAEVHRPADEKRLNVEWSLVEPSGVIGDEDEHIETDLAAFSQSSAGNHDDGNRKNHNFSNKLLRHLSHGGRQLSWF